jgi:hypothetical protein
MSYLLPKPGNSRIEEVWEGPGSPDPTGYIVSWPDSYQAFSYDDHRPLGSRRTLEAAHQLVDVDADREAAEEAARTARVLAACAELDS